MRARTASRLLFGILGFMILSLALMSLGGDDEARSILLQVLLVAITVGGLWYLSYRFRIAPRRAVFSDEARMLGLRASAGDATRFLDSGFEVVRRRASVRDVETTAVGTWRGHEVAVVDYWYAPTSDTSRDDYVRFVCALLPAPATWSRLLVVPERLATLVSDALLGLDPETESEEFNRRYAIRADDRRFASAVLDARMIEWILSLPEHTGFEIRDGRLLSFVARREIGSVEHALVTADAFLARVPGAARSLFG
jgi:hypothetical protein